MKDIKNKNGCLFITLRKTDINNQEYLNKIKDAVMRKIINDNEIKNVIIDCKNITSFMQVPVLTFKKINKILLAVIGKLDIINVKEDIKEEILEVEELRDIHSCLK